MGSEGLLRVSSRHFTSDQATGFFRPEAGTLLTTTLAMTGKLDRLALVLIGPAPQAFRQAIDTIRRTPADYSSLEFLQPNC